MLRTLPNKSWDDSFDQSQCHAIRQAMERGNIIFFPEMRFELLDQEIPLLDEDIIDKKRKNISFNGKAVSGLDNDDKALILKSMMQRFMSYTKKLIIHTLPDYGEKLIIGRTSYRPASIADRSTSYKKDDTRLHVDAFPSSPVQGKRILRVFSNIHPRGVERVWRIGEPFEKVVGRFLPKARKYHPIIATVLHRTKITKSKRSRYDHYMNEIHNLMKADLDYQEKVLQSRVEFPSGSSWMVFTDQVSHAAMQGQYALEQTFYVPANAIHDYEHSPLAILNKYLNKT